VEEDVLLCAIRLNEAEASVREANDRSFHWIGTIWKLLTSKPSSAVKSDLTTTSKSVLIQKW
jgi:hypothetical protein